MRPVITHIVLTVVPGYIQVIPEHRAPNSSKGSHFSINYSQKLWLRDEFYD